MPIRRDPVYLMHIILQEWTRCLPKPYSDDASFSAATDGLTDCNRFVNGVAQSLGYTKFQPDPNKLPILANPMIDYMIGTRKEWWELSGLVAQQFANMGVFIVAGWKNPAGGHGHVCVVRPGKATTSGKWPGEVVPMVANVSVPSLCRIDRGSNWAFGAKPPLYFALGEMMP